MVSPSQDPPQDPPHTHTNPYLSTLTTPTPETLHGPQYPYMAHYYANTHNPNGLQALSPYSTPYSTTTSNGGILTPSLRDRYKESGMMVRMGPILLSLICSRYQDLPSKSNPLLPIRLADRRGAEVAAPFLFRTLSLLNLQATRMRRLLQQAPKLGVHVRRLIIQPRLDEQAVPDIDKLDPCIVEFLRYLPNVEELVIWSISRDTYSHPELLNSFGALLPRLRCVELQEEGFQYEIPYPEKPQEFVANTWQNHLSVTLLLYRPNTLTHVTIVSRLPLHTTVFFLLRDSAVALQSISLTNCIGLSIQNLFVQPVRWACASTLRSLSFHQCRGVHVGTLVRHIAAGLFGYLEQLTLHGCGDPSDIPDIPSPYELRWTLPPIQTLELNHCDAWRVKACSMLHVDTLIMPRASADTFLHLFMDQNHLSFPGLREIRAPVNITETFPEHLFFGAPFLKNRGITLVHENPTRVSCSCPMN